MGIEKDEIRKLKQQLSEAKELVKELRHFLVLRYPEYEDNYNKVMVKVKELLDE